MVQGIKGLPKNKIPRETQKTKFVENDNHYEVIEKVLAVGKHFLT